MTLDAVEFLRRFLLHVLPKGFMRIRYYGFLANRNRSEKLQRVRALLAQAPLSSSAELHFPPSQDSTNEIPSFQISELCPACKKGRLIPVAAPIGAGAYRPGSTLNLVSAGIDWGTKLKVGEGAGFGHGACAAVGD
jgi:hypothetical protein